MARITIEFKDGRPDEVFRSTPYRGVEVETAHGLVTVTTTHLGAARRGETEAVSYPVEDVLRVHFHDDGR